MINREKLAQMSNDELAEFICEQHTMCINCIGQTECCTGGNGVKVWLESEAEEDNE
jgi:hypothetical protein